MQKSSSVEDGNIPPFNPTRFSFGSRNKIPNMMYMTYKGFVLEEGGIHIQLGVKLHLGEQMITLGT